MNDMQKLKYDLSLHYASIMVQHDIASGKLSHKEMYLIRNAMVSYAADFAEILTDGTMSEESLNDLLEYFT